jgi:hypothetical protein
MLTETQISWIYIFSPSMPSWHNVELVEHRDFFLFLLWLCSAIQALVTAMKLSVLLQLLDLGQTVGPLGRAISWSRGLYLYSNTEKHTHNTNTKHPCSAWDSSLRSRLPREWGQFMPQTARLLWPAKDDFTYAFYEVNVPKLNSFDTENVH